MTFHSAILWFNKPSARYGLWFFIAFLFALAQFHTILFIYGNAFVASIQASQGVVKGLPHWLIYQSRVLGPYTVEFLHLFIANYNAAYGVFVVSAMSVAGFLVFLTTRHCLPQVPSFAAFVVFQLFFALLLSPNWLYSWDHYGLIFFTLFFYFVMQDKDWRWFSGLFVVAIFNRESAFYFALWMLIDPCIKYFLHPANAAQARKPFDLRMFAAGATCIALGYGLITFLRKTLLIKEMAPELFNLHHMAGKSVHFTFYSNLKLISDAVANFGSTFDIVILFFMLLVLFLAFCLTTVNPIRFLGLALSHVALLISILLFAQLLETRVYLELVPFVCFSVFLIYAEFRKVLSSEQWAGV
jgi:hypothetical protein